MDSSAARFVEHISGSAKAQEWIRSRLKIEINQSTGTGEKTGVINKLKSMTRPELELDLNEEEIRDLPEWLVDDEEFNRERDLEIQRYQRLLSANESIVAPRDKAKLDLLVHQFASGQKILAFDHSICTVNYYKAALQQMGVERLDVYSSAQNQQKLVADARKNSA